MRCFLRGLILNRGRSVVMLVGVTVAVVALRCDQSTVVPVSAHSVG